MRSAVRRTPPPPADSVASIGQTDNANHNYDLTDFDAALTAGNLPAVSFLKAAEYQTGTQREAGPSVCSP